MTTEPVRMTYEQKGTAVYLLVVLVTYGVYLALILPAVATTPVAEIGYVAPLLWTIGASIVSAIVLRILVEIVRPSELQRDDIRDRDIRRAAARLGYWPLVAGGIVALLLAILRLDPFWIANVIYLAFVAQAVLTSIIALTLYRRGL